MRGFQHEFLLACKRVVRADWHSCRGARAVRRWLSIAELPLDELVHGLKPDISDEGLIWRKPLAHKGRIKQHKCVLIITHFAANGSRRRQSPVWSEFVITTRSSGLPIMKADQWKRQKQSETLTY